MTRIFPHPILAVALVVMWLLLNGLSVGHLVLGTAIALIAGQAMAALDPVRPRIRSWGALVKLFLIVMVDIVISNVQVARIILVGRRFGLPRAGFVEIDLELRNPTGLAILGVIVTATPGTTWMDYDAARGRLLLHVFNLVDEETWRDTVNNRYGGLLKEIFE